MSAANVDVTQHARTRWLQRVAADDPFPASSIRDAFEEAVDTGGEQCHRRYHRGLDVHLVARQRGAVERIVTVYKTAAGGEE